MKLSFADRCCYVHTPHPSSGHKEEAPHIQLQAYVIRPSSMKIASKAQVNVKQKLPAVWLASLTQWDTSPEHPEMPFIMELILLFTPACSRLSSFEFTSLKWCLPRQALGCNTSPTSKGNMLLTLSKRVWLNSKQITALSAAHSIAPEESIAGIDVWLPWKRSFTCSFVFITYILYTYWGCSWVSHWAGNSEQEEEILYQIHVCIVRTFCMFKKALCKELQKLEAWIHFYICMFTA